MSSSSRTDSSYQPDHLSNLPDALLIIILSFLPTRIAARTSFLSRRFRHLWKACPAVDLSADRCTNIKIFEAMANSALSRDPSNPFLRLCLRLEPGFFRKLRERDSCLPSLLAKAHSLGLRHLTFDHCGIFDHTFDDLDPLTVSIICSIDSLQSLKLPTVPPQSLPSVVNLPCLKTLSLTFDIETTAEAYLSDSDSDSIHEDYSTDFNRFLSQISFLEDLNLRLNLNAGFTLSSQTIRKLELFIDEIFDPDEFVNISMPSQEMLRLEMLNIDCDRLPRIEVNMPSLRKADLKLRKVHEGDIGVVARLLNCVSRVEDLRLDIVEYLNVNYPFPVLLEPGKDVPYFPNLKHLDMNMCFHEHNFESVLVLLRHSPALESLKVVYEAPDPKYLTLSEEGRVVRVDAVINYDHNCIRLRDLHLGQHGKDFMKLVRKRTKTIKRQEEADLLKNLVFVL
ncbi:F-box/FBD/LRR protein [Rhynchospora pubera]|uniref:F-box/FBD/LRR protein n=1 Tax=Rhynchospora pubera TaxID=906938 RepID=A0AAV8BRM9_9POAL|nr:F-box/FBD/LRR protein [Rhynchospora pubera]